VVRKARLKCLRRFVGRAEAALVRRRSQWAGRSFREAAVRAGLVPAHPLIRRGPGACQEPAGERRRGLMAARAARSSAVTGWSRCARSQVIVSVSRSAVVGAPAAASRLYCACPPGRCSGITRSRATRVAIFGCRSHVAAHAGTGQGWRPLPAEVSKVALVHVQHPRIDANPRVPAPPGRRNSRPVRDGRVPVQGCRRRRATNRTGAPAKRSAVPAPGRGAARQARPRHLVGRVRVRQHDTVCAASSASRPCGTSIRNPPSVVTDGAAPQMATR